MVQRVRHVGELDEIAKVFDGGVAPPFVQIAHEGRAVGRREHGALAADVNAARRIPRVLHKFARRVVLHDLARQAAREMDALAFHIAASLAKQIQRLGVVAKVDAHLFKNRVAVALDQRQALFAQHFINGNLARDVGHRHGRACGPRGALGLAPTGAPVMPYLGWRSAIGCAFRCTRRRVAGGGIDVVHGGLLKSWRRDAPVPQYRFTVGK